MNALKFPSADAGLCRQVAQTEVSRGRCGYYKPINFYAFGMEHMWNCLGLSEQASNKNRPIILSHLLYGSAV